MSDLYGVGTRLGANGTAMEWFDKTTGRTVFSVDAIGTTTGQPQQTVVFTATLAQINTGLTFLADVSGRTIIPTGFTLTVLGTAGGLTDVRLSDTAGSPIDIVTVVAAGLVSGAVITPSSGVLTQSPPELGDVTLGAGYGAALTAGKGMQIRKTGSTGTGLTSITGIVHFIYG